jgi:cell division protein FtsL
MMKSDIKKWKKDKKRREEIVKAKHVQSQHKDEITQTDKALGINHIIIMVGMVILVLGFILYRMS